MDAEKLQENEEKVYKCEKCGKEKKESEGVWLLSGSTFCCKKCCDIPKKENAEDKSANICEFC